MKVIGEYVFRASGLESVIIPSGVEIIGEYSFADCSELKSVEIPNTVAEIKDGAFYWCDNLHSITIPESVIKIGKRALGYIYFYDAETGTEHIEPLEDFIIYAYIGSAAEVYANENGIKFVAIEEKTSEPTTDKPTEKPVTYVTGDANGDGRITAADARTILRISAKLDKLESYNLPLEAVDVTKDGKITAADARKILRVSAKLETM